MKINKQSIEHSLKGKKVAVLATDGVEESEFSVPVECLTRCGAKVTVVSLEKKEIKGWFKDHWTSAKKVDLKASEADANDYDALLLPGGVMNPDALRKNRSAVNFVRDFFKHHKPVAAICHGPQILIDAEVLEGRRVTSYSSIRKDLENAGAEWVDEEVVVDNGLVTSRTPDDLPAFCDKLCEEVEEGVHAGQNA